MTLAQTIQSDLDVFFQSDEFGVPFTYQLVVGGAVHNLVGVFDNASTQVDDLGPVGVQINEATITCKLADLPAGHGERDLVSVNAKDYRVAAPIDADGQGLAVLELEIVE